MVAITNIGGIAQAAQKEAPLNRSSKGDPRTLPLRDDVEISTEALDTAQAQHLAKQAEERDEIRQTRVEEAREHIREGHYKLQQVVKMVAASISGYVI